jgi:hypothetical protein
MPFEVLRLPKGDLGPMAKPKRTAAIEAAHTWPIGTHEQREYVIAFESGDFRIALGKPGKEASDEWATGRGKRKPHDMAPTVFFQGKPLNFFPTFENLFQDIHGARREAGAASESILEAMAALLFRSSYMLDHDFTTNGQPRGGFHAPTIAWTPPEEVMNFLIEEVPHMGPNLLTSDNGEARLPTDVYLQLIEAIALNEDVKYQGESVVNAGVVDGNVGRVNNLCTLVTFIAADLERVPLAKFAAKLIKSRGVSGLSRKDAEAHFPVLVARD